MGDEHAPSGCRLREPHTAGTEPEATPAWEIPAVKTALVAAVCIASLILGGCWDQRETSQISIITAIAADWIDGQYLVTAEATNTRAVATPGQGGGAAPNKPETVLYTGHGATPMEALDDIEHVSSRKVFWASAHVLIIGSGLAQRGIVPLLDGIARDARFRITERVLIASGSAQSILATRVPGVETDVGKEIYLLAQSMTQLTSEGYAPHMYDLMRWDAEPGRDPLVVGVSLVSSPVPNGPKYTLSESAVLHDGRLVAWLPRDQVTMALWLEGLFKAGTFPLTCPGNPNRVGRFRVIKVTSRTRPIIKDETITAMDVQLGARAGVIQSPCSGATLNQLRESAESELRSSVEKTVAGAQQQQNDIFGWGDMVYRWHPGLWKTRYEGNWRTVFGSLPVHMSVEVNMQYTGETLLNESSVP